MQIERLANRVVVRAPAKVNLFLEVLGKRPDGYHEIATLMVAVSLEDTLELTEEASGAIRLECDHPTLTLGPENLIHKAAEVLRRRTGCARGARIQLVKRIPLAAGLAGGSTDGAAGLAGLNRLWQLGLETEQLAELGAELGSDVPFFFATPAAWCTGRGEQVAPLQLGATLHFVLACPPVGLSTAEVYRGVTVPERSESGEAIRQAAEAGDVEAVGRRLHNRLQEPAERMSPAVAELRARLQALGPAGQLMSGSGSSVFALCRDHGEALRVARGLSTGTEGPSAPVVFVVRDRV